jgi:hypothetical protein
MKINMAATRAELESEPAEVDEGNKRMKPAHWNEMSRDQRKRWRARN